MNLRDWLIVIGVVIIVGILLDGYRRMRLAKKDSLQMSRDMGGQIEGTPLDDDFNPELPGGGARVVASGVDSSPGATNEGGAGGANYPADGLSATDSIQARSGSGLADSDIADVESNPITATREDYIPPHNASQADDRPVYTNDDNVQVKTAHAGRTMRFEEAGDKIPDDQEVLVINVDCKNPNGFAGTDLKKLLEACGLDHGDMSIFHRHEENDLLSPIQFSVANAVEPGYFDPQGLEELVTPGVSFFMSLPGPKDYMKAFDYMLETAQVFARNLDGELKDEHRSVMTAQTIEHSRQRIREFERKQLSKARA